MAFADDLGKDFREALSFGTQVRFRYFTHTIGSGYDDDISLSQSGTDLWISGLLLPLEQTEGSNDFFLLQQGRVKNDDLRLYVNGSLTTNVLFKVGVGSPPSEEYAGVDDGIFVWSIGGQPIYKKLFVRRLPTGSLD